MGQLSSKKSIRRRLTREERRRQLLEVSWRIIQDGGSDTLTLGRLANRAGVAKPVVYDHFNTRNGLLVALYEDFDARQAPIMNAAIQAGEATLNGKARVIASSYVDCVLLQGREMPDVLAALAGSPELEKTKRSYQAGFLEKCRLTLAPFAEGGDISTAGLWGVLGAAETLSKAAVSGDITPEQAKDVLFQLIVTIVESVNTECQR
ncbi:MAG: TetR/AcrR family transcriptional regulator [Chromatiales bacterium]|nr:TetR/AcrR family transcriptional regulator [Chromatiales bacterium]